MNEMRRAPNNIGKFDTLFAKKTGEIVGINKRRLYETPFFLLTSPPRNDIVVASVDSSAAAAMRVSAEGPMQLTELGAVFDKTHGDVLVRMYMRDGSGTDMIMNSPCHIRTIFGPGGQMYPLPEGLFIDEERALSIVFSSLDPQPPPPPAPQPPPGNPTSARICAVGAKYSQLELDPQLRRVKERLAISQFLTSPYFYTLDSGFATVPPLSTIQVEVEIGSQHNFEIHQFSAVSDGTFNLDIVDLSKGESIINAPRGTHYGVPSTLLLGSGAHPYRLHEPVMVFAGQRLLVTLTDTSNLVVPAPPNPQGNRVFLTLGGNAVKARMWS